MRCVLETYITPRITAIRDEYLQARPSVCINRALAFTDVYRRNPGLPTVIKRARAFRAACERAPLAIFDNELLISHPAGRRRGGECSPEIAWRWLADELDTLSTRSQDPYDIDESDKRRLREEIFPFWKGQSLDEMAETQLREAGLWSWSHEAGICDLSIKTQNGGGDSCPGYGNLLLRRGMAAICNDAYEQLARLDSTCPEHINKIHFMQSVTETCEGVMLYARRYANHAQTLAGSCADPIRAQELRKVAEICRRVPAHPPRNFHEALQSVWFLQSLFTLEENQTGISLGRADQYLWPFLEKDLKEGTLTKAEAGELICCWLVKMSEVMWLCSADSAMYFAGYQPFINLVVGGQKREGGDATNMLSMMFMDCSAQLKLYQPALAVRIHNASPEPFMRKIVEVVRSGMGFPACHFDDAHIKMMLRKGLDYEDARDYCIMGCVEPQVAGRMYQWTSAGYTTFTAAIELALNDGHSPRDGSLQGERTGKPESFSDYASFEKAVWRQLDFIIRRAAQATLILQRLHRDYAPKPLISCLTEGCLEQGLNVMDGGARFNNGPGLIWTGLADYANSMVAIRELVYRRRQVSLPGLVQALKDNFAGHTALHHACMEVAKYGNDIEEVDNVARDLINYVDREHRKYRMLYGPFTLGTLSISNNTPFGKLTGALPCGRLAGRPLADGISPAQQTDVLGPTAVISSVSRINVEAMEVGMVHNFKLMYGILESEEGERGLINLLRTASLLGNAQMQFSYIDNETLLEAQRSPEDYRSLMIRVAGYSAFFTELSREVQDEIISRTVQSGF